MMRNKATDIAAPATAATPSMPLNLVLFALCMYLLISPLYILPSGNPQPADWLIIAVALPTMTLVFVNTQGRINPHYLPGFLFAGWASIINVTNYIFFQDTRMLQTALMYGYNMLVFLFAVYVFTKMPERARKYCFITLVLATILQTLWVIFLDDPARPRTIGTFNNPNQLGYWTLLTGMMIILLRGEKYIGLPHILLLLALSYITFFTASKASIFAFTLLWLVTLGAFPLSPTIRTVLMATIVLGVVFIAFNPASLVSAYDTVKTTTNRVQKIFVDIAQTGEKKGESLKDRGFYRITRNPHYSLFGAGEGAFDRFDSPPKNQELHSGWATLIVSYGIIGVVTFAAFVFVIINRLHWSYIMLLLPIFLYGITHQNLRFTHFWVLIALLYVIKLNCLKNSDNLHKRV